MLKRKGCHFCIFFIIFQLTSFYTFAQENTSSVNSTQQEAVTQSLNSSATIATAPDSNSLPELPETSTNNNTQPVTTAASSNSSENANVTINTTVPQSGNNTSPENTTVPQRGNNTSPGNTTVPQSGNNTSPEDTTVPQSGNSTSPGNTTVPQSGNNTSPENTTVPQRGSNTSPENTTVPQNGNTTSPENTTVPQNDAGNNTSPEINTVSTNPVSENGNASTESTRVKPSTRKMTTETSDNATDETPLPAVPSNVLSIFFVNDLQYDLFPVHLDNGSICDGNDNVTDCVGGIGRLKSFIKSKMKVNPNTLWLNAGNTLGGPWFNILKYKTALEALKFLNFSFMAVGPDVFQYGPEPSRQFLEEFGSSVVISNINNSNVMKSGEYSMGMCNISVIGFVDDNKFKNVTEAIAQEINKTRSEQNNTSHVITIALGSTTRQNATMIANTTSGIDIMLYNGGNCTSTGTKDNTTKDFCSDTVNKTDNNITYVYSLGMNHSDMAARFLVGELQITIGNNCRIDNITFNPHNYSNMTDDPWTSNLTQIAGFADLSKKLTGNSKNLSGESQMCSHAECSLGDLIADSMLAALGNDMWSEDAARIAVFPAVMFQDNKIIPKGDINATQLYSLVPHDAYLCTVALTGLQLTEMLTVSLKNNHRENSTDFLHVSSLLHVKYNRSKDAALNIISISTVPNNSDTMRLQAINMTDSKTLYNVVMPYTLFEMDSYKALLDSVNGSRISYHNVTVIEALIRTINNTGFLTLPIVGNRQYESEPIEIQPPPDCPSYTGTTILVTLVVTALILGACYGTWWYILRRRRVRSNSTMAMMNFEYDNS